MSDSYARIKTEEAKRLATLTVEVINAARKALDKQRADAVIAKREKRRKIFRWLKPLNEEQARIAVLLAGKTSCCMYWNAYNSAWAILNLVKAAGSDPYIYITAQDYERIQHGADYVRLSTN